MNPSTFADYIAFKAELAHLLSVIRKDLTHKGEYGRGFTAALDQVAVSTGLNQRTEYYVDLRAGSRRRDGWRE